MVDAWLITGIPGAGKTTASQLARRATRGCRGHRGRSAPGLDRVGQRVARPGARGAHLEGPLVEQLSGVGLWIDNAALAPDATVDLVLANRDQARLAQGI